MRGPVRRVLAGPLRGVTAVVDGNVSGWRVSCVQPVSARGHPDKQQPGFELFRVSLLIQGRPADAGRRAPAVGDRRPLLSAAPLATAADHSARRARERRPDHKSEAPVRPLSSRLAGHLRGCPASSRHPRRPMFAAWLGAVTMEITGLMPVRG